ncbi:MAG: hypothetical protein AB8G86_13445 [Saprospiraceae bacterium]
MNGEIEDSIKLLIVIWAYTLMYSTTPKRAQRYDLLTDVAGKVTKTVFK